MDVDLNGDVPRIGKPKELFGVHLVYPPMSPEWGAYDVAADGKQFLWIVVCPLSMAGFEREIYFSRRGENVAQFVIFPKNIGIRYGGMVEQFEHCH